MFEENSLWPKDKSGSFDEDQFDEGAKKEERKKKKVGRIVEARNIDSRV